MAQLHFDNSYTVTMPLRVGTGSPIDVRTIVANLSDLLNKDTFGNLTQICAGMPIAVVEKGKSGIWYLPDQDSYDYAKQAMLSGDLSSGVPASVTEELVASYKWVKLPTTAEVDEALEEIKSSLTAEGISYTRTGKDYDDVAGAIEDLYKGLASAGSQEGINDLTNKVTALEDTVNGKGETPSLQSQITANANAIALLNGKVTYKIVESLPTENIDTNVFYLVLDSEAAEDGETVYKEYLYVNNKWELVGTTHTSLEGYITEEDAKKYADDQAAQALADAKKDTASQIQALNLATTYAPISVVETAEGAADKAEENAGKIADLETTVNGAEGTTGLVARVGALEDYKTTHDGLYKSLNQQVSTNTGAIETINNNLGGYLTKADAEATYETIENVAALTKTVGDNKTAAETGIKEAKDLAQEAKDGLADKVTNSSLATTLASYQTQDLTITDFDTEGVQATVESALLANKNAMAANATAINGLSGRMDAVEALAGNAATKESVEALAGEQGRVTVAEGKVSTLEGVVGDAEGGLVKDVADLAANKADAATVESTYLKKSGDTSLKLGSDTSESTQSGSITIFGKNDYGPEYDWYGRQVDITPKGMEVLIPDEGISKFAGGHIYLVDGQGELDISTSNGFVGDTVDTTIPKEPEVGHIATTGAIKTYVDAEVKSVKDSVATAYTFKGSKTYAEISAITDAKVGDVYNSTTEVTLNGVKYPVGTNFAWDGEAWEPLSGTIDISAYATTASVTEALEAQAESFQGIIDGVEEEVEKKAAIDGSNLGTLSDTAKASWKSALGFATAADQVQSDWNVTNTSSKAYIANKPAITAGSGTEKDHTVNVFNDGFGNAWFEETDYKGPFTVKYGTNYSGTSSIVRGWGSSVSISPANHGTGFSVIIEDCISTFPSRVDYTVTPRFSGDGYDAVVSDVELTREHVYGVDNGLKMTVTPVGESVTGMSYTLAFNDSVHYEIRYTGYWI